MPRLTKQVWKRYLPFGNIIYPLEMLFTLLKCYLRNENVIYLLIKMLFTLWKFYLLYENVINVLETAFIKN